jgi:hypothetical protein
MPRSALALLALLVAAPASAQLPAVPPAVTPAVGVPTYWVMMVTGEKDGTPWMKTTTPETLGGAVKGTGPWSCVYPPTERGGEGGTGYERMEISCGIGDVEVFMSQRCDYRIKAKPGSKPGKGWRRSELQTLNLRRRGDAKSTITVSLRCDVDAAFSLDRP